MTKTRRDLLLDKMLRETAGVENASDILERFGMDALVLTLEQAKAQRGRKFIRQRQLEQREFVQQKALKSAASEKPTLDPVFKLPVKGK